MIRTSSNCLNPFPFNQSHAILAHNVVFPAPADWDLDQLYDFAKPLGAHIISARYCRYVVDLNRPGDGSSLYPGQKTGLVPLETFTGDRLYDRGAEPNEKEIARRREKYWQPYHEKIEAALSAIKSRYGFAVLFDCHSIKSEVPRLFEGKLSDLNLGTADGISCSNGLRRAIEKALSKQSDFTVTIDGRFKGGFITRHYGQPKSKIHAYQIEHSTNIYMDEKPDLAWNEAKASLARPILQNIFETTMRWAYLQNDY